MDDELQAIADKADTLILSFVAPDRAMKISPVGAVYAHIDIDDLYNIEKVIEDLSDKNQLPKKLHLVIHTTGGLANISTKIANYLRKTFEEIHAFVPYEASSGGTVLCLAANTITMGNVANLTPIDPQTRYQGERVSSTSYQLAIRELEKRFGKKLPLEIPPPYQQLCEKLDPVILKEMNKLWQDACDVAAALLKRSYQPKNDDEEAQIIDTAISLSFGPRPHGHIIDADEALDFGLRIDNSSANMKTLKIYKKWVKSMLEEEKATHVIKHYNPKTKTTARKRPTARKAGR